MTAHHSKLTESFHTVWEACGMADNLRRALNVLGVPHLLQALAAA
jgi:hypothetical protein